VKLKRSGLFKVGLALTTLLSCGLAAPALAAQAPTTIKLEPYLGALWSFQAQLNGKPETFLFDTGGGLTVLTPQTAAKIGCEPWGQISGFRMRGDRVDLKQCEDLTFGAGGATLKAPTAGVWDFSNALPKDAPPLAGSIALDSFAGRVVTVDLAHRQVVIETPESLKARIAAAKEVELRLGREATGLSVTPFVAVQTPKGKVWFELDTGSTGPAVIGSHTVGLLGMKADNSGPQPLRAELVGGVPLTTERALTASMIIDGNIGAPTLAQWIVTLDLAHGRAWIAPAAKP
jgi:predicted aspartyl protease